MIFHIYNSTGRNCQKHSAQRCRCLLPSGWVLFLSLLIERNRRAGGYIMARPRLRAQFFCGAKGIWQRSKSLTSKQRMDIFRDEGNTCKKCGREVSLCGSFAGYSPYEGLPVGQVDHILPISRGGNNSRSNLQVLCHTCNGMKGTR